MHRRQLLALVLGASAAQATAFPPARGDLVFVLNSGDASLSLIDRPTLTERRRVPMLREPHHLCFTPDGKEIVIGESGGNELFFTDPVTGEWKRRVRVGNPYHLAYSPDGKWLVVCSLRRDQIDIYDARTLELVRRHSIRDMPSHLAFAPDSGAVFCTLQGTNQAVAIDLASHAIRWVAEVGRAPAGIAWLVVGLTGSDHAAIVDPANGAVERRVTTGRGAHAVYPSPDGRLVYITNRVDSGLTALDTASLNVARSYPMPGGPDCLDFAPDGKVWITLRWAGRVAVLDPEAGTYETLRVGRSPHGIMVGAAGA
jgi:DNA-binding beta-propeller fold protein YncE